MTYYDYISLFEGIEHPYGDLVGDIKAEVDQSTDPDELMDIFEGSSFSSIYDHLTGCQASQECMNTFIQSWASYLKHEKKALCDPVPAMVLYQLSDLNRGTKYLECLQGINTSLRKISRTLAEVTGNNGEDQFLRIGGVIDTFEQN